MTTQTEEVLDQLGIQRVSSGTEIACKCPFHKDSHPSFSMNARSGLWICYQCGQSGTLEMLIKLVGGSDLDADVVLREIKYEKVREKSKPRVVADKVVGPVDHLLLKARFESYRRPPTWARTQRRLRLGVIEAFDLRWDHGWIIPIWDAAAHLLGWQYKRLDFVSNFPKAVKKSQTLFGLRELQGSAAAVVESPLDVCRMATVGIPAVATYGAFVSRAQTRLLIEHLDRVVIALDNDEEGGRQATKLFPYLAKSIPTSTAQYPDGVKDPGDMSDQQLQRTFGDIQGDAQAFSIARVRADAQAGLVPSSA